MNDQVGIIIPSLNSPIIDQVLTSITGQEGADKVKEIWVVGKDRPGLVRQDGIVRLLDTIEVVSPGTARNLGIEAANAGLLIFLDSDCLAQPGWLAGHLAAHAAGHAVVGGGVVPQGSGYWHLSYNLTLFHEFFSNASAGPRNYLPTLNLSVKREVVTAAGLLDESLTRGQDVEWTTRMRQAGYQPYFLPDAAVRHEHSRATFAAVWRDCARSGYHMRQVRLRHPDLLSAPSLLRHRRLVLALSPLIAAWVTIRLVASRPAVFIRQWATLPAIYLTKIAWCWGASRIQEP